jgi:hypothetical protein
MYLNIATAHLDVGTLGSQQDVLGCLDLHCIGSTGDGYSFVSRNLGFVALALARYFAAGGVQFDTDLLVGLLGVAGLTVGEQADAACLGLQLLKWCYRH